MSAKADTPPKYADILKEMVADGRCRYEMDRATYDELLTGVERRPTPEHCGMPMTLLDGVRVSVNPEIPATEIRGFRRGEGKVKTFKLEAR